MSARALIAALPLFKSLDRASLDRLSAAATRLAVKRGERVFSKGDVLTGMYVLVYGQIRLMAHGTRGRRLAGVVQPGSSFGEPTMFLENPAGVDAEAVTDALVLQVPKSAVFEELEHSPLFARRMIAALCQRIHALVTEAERHAIPTGRARLIQYLVRSAQRDKDGAHVVLPAPKAVVASHLHLTPEHFSRLLHELASEGLLKVSARRIGIDDLERLAATGAAQDTAGRRAHDPRADQRCP
jgi:CRP/FNR family transcriptional regulator, dissimilatory nitrate respiration regulator